MKEREGDQFRGQSRKDEQCAADAPPVEQTVKNDADAVAWVQQKGLLDKTVTISDDSWSCHGVEITKGSVFYSTRHAKDCPGYICTVAHGAVPAIITETSVIEVTDQGHHA